MSLSTPILTLICCACAVPHSEHGRKRRKPKSFFISVFLLRLCVLEGGMFAVAIVVSRSPAGSRRP